MAEQLKAPFPYFGGKSGAVAQVWEAFGEVKNYVEPFMGSAAMLLGAPEGKRIETINDFDGFVANFFRAVAHDPDAVAHAADWPCNEIDLEARNWWLTNQQAEFKQKLGDPDFYDAKVAGWWVWGMCNSIGDGWIGGKGPWTHDGEKWNKRPRSGNKHIIPHLGDAGNGINRQLPHLSAGRGGEHPRTTFIREWMQNLHQRLRDVRVTCGDWSRVVKDSVTTRHGLSGIFLDPPYEKGAMDYGAGGMGLGIAKDVQAWCAANGDNPLLRIVLCGHVGEHDALLAHGWHVRKWKARKGYAMTAEAVANSAGETLWCSPHCVQAPEFMTNQPLAIMDSAQAAIKDIAQLELA